MYCAEYPVGGAVGGVKSKVLVVAAVTRTRGAGGTDTPLQTPVVDVGTIVLAFVGGRLCVFLGSFMVAVVREM